MLGVAAALALAGCSPGATRPAAPPAPAGAAQAPAASMSTGTPVPTATSAGALSVSTPVAPDSPAPPISGGAASVTSATAPPGRLGSDAATQRHPFAPTSITLHLRGADEAHAAVETVDTGPGGELRLPADPGHVGWWQSGAMSGDAYGSVVLAGHIDSRDRGIGFLVRLLQAQPGDEVVLDDGAYEQRYRVGSAQDVPKASLATSTDTFSQSVPGRLVLLTCTGPFDPVTHYPDNLVVLADPVGVPTPHS